MAQGLQKWALITGVTAGGIGDALAQELLRRNINVIATALDLKLLDYLQRPESKVQLEKLQLDVTKPSTISDAVSQTSRITNGKLHYLFNNAGYGYMMPLLDADPAAVRKNFDVNVFGLLEVTQAFFPLLRAAKGVVVNQSSITGLTGVYQPYIGTYCATKAAVSAMSNTMRVEFAPFGVKVRITVSLSTTAAEMLVS